MIPPRFDLKPVDKTKTRLNAVVRLAKRQDVTQLINACAASPEGGPVQIAVRNRDPGTVELKVANSGKSSPANERLAVFEPRVRGSNASDSSIPGNGLCMGAP